MRRTIALFAATLAAGCASPIGPNEADVYFILEAPAAAPAAAAVSVAPTSAAAFYDTQDIVYSRAPGTRGYYQFNHWTERPQRAIQAQLAARLDNGGARSGPVLSTHLDEIYHDAAQAPGTARIAITARLVDRVSGAELARRSFARSAPAASNDAPGAVRGFGQALGALLDDVAAWVAAEAPAARIKAQ